MKKTLITYFVFVLIAMLTVTTWASFQENVFTGGLKLFSEPWGLATLADAYFGFLTFYLWVWYKESAWKPRLLWLLAILALGNMAMAIYALIQLKKAKSDNFESVLLRS